MLTRNLYTCCSLFIVSGVGTDKSHRKYDSAFKITFTKRDTSVNDIFVYPKNVAYIKVIFLCEVLIELISAGEFRGPSLNSINSSIVIGLPLLILPSSSSKTAGSI